MPGGSSGYESNPKLHKSMGVRLSNLDNLIAKTTFAEITRSLE
jgi:hypothetical protein